MLVYNELDDVKFFCLSRVELEYFEKNDLFGKEVSKSFSSTQLEIREAGNCFSLV